MAATGSSSHNGFSGVDSDIVSATEHDPLLDSSSSSVYRPVPAKKNWYRARPLWYVPVPPIRSPTDL